MRRRKQSSIVGPKLCCQGASEHRFYLGGRCTLGMVVVVLRSRGGLAPHLDCSQFLLLRVLALHDLDANHEKYGEYDVQGEDDGGPHRIAEQLGEVEQCDEDRDS